MSFHTHRMIRKSPNSTNKSHKMSIDQHKDKVEPLCIIGRNKKWCSQYGKHCKICPLKRNLILELQYHPADTNLKELKKRCIVKRRLCPYFPYSNSHNKQKVGGKQTICLEVYLMQYNCLMSFICFLTCLVLNQCI